MASFDTLATSAFETTSRRRRSFASEGDAVTRPVEVTRPDKLLWPALEITKRRYVDYLDAVGDRMLPWLRERPLTVVRAPDGVAGERYYQKDTPRYAPSWIRTVGIPAPSARREVAYTVCNDASTLTWLGNQAALEFHPAPVRRDRLERPDLLTVDIDPPDDAFDAAVEVALSVLEVTDDLRLTTLVKTSGGKGLHVVMPIRRHVSPEELRHAAAVLSYLHNMLAYTTLREESGLSGEEIGEAIGWAIRTLVADLRRQPQLPKGG